jgi:hypothetical protein
MPVFGLFTATATATKPEKKPVFEHIVSHNDSMAVVESSPRSVASAVQPVASPVIPLLESPSTHAQTAKPSTNIHRFSLRALALASAFAHSEPKHKSTLSNQQEKKAYAAAAFSKRIIVQSLMPSSERRAKQSALVVRSLIIGPSVSPASPKLTMAIAMPQLGKVKSQLMQPKLANKLIVHLRALPSSGVEGENGKQAAAGPIHAVCLKHTDAEEHALYFSRLKSDTTFVPDMKSLDFAAIANTSIETLSSMFNNMQLVSLISSPDLGLGQPGDGPGILSGAVPTAETVIRGFEEITPQLFALGYATGRVILPNHQGVIFSCHRE